MDSMVTGGKWQVNKNDCLLRACNSYFGALRAMLNNVFLELGSVRPGALPANLCDQYESEAILADIITTDRMITCLDSHYHVNAIGNI